VTCHNCHTDCKRDGRDRKGNQRYQCRQCSKVFLEPREDHLNGMYLPIEKAEMVLRLLLEGNSVSSVERATEVHHTTILKLLVQVGEKCERIMAEKVSNVECRDVEADEVWSFVGKKQKRVRPRTIRTLAIATFSSQLNGTANWCSTSLWASAISAPRIASLKASVMRLRARRFKSQRMVSLLTAPRSPRRCMTRLLASRN
jgi:transposase-like protein